MQKILKTVDPFVVFARGSIRCSGEMNVQITARRFLRSVRRRALNAEQIQFEETIKMVQRTKDQNKLLQDSLSSKKLSVELTVEPLTKKKNIFEDSKETPSQIAVIKGTLSDPIKITSENQFQMIAERVTPLYKMPYAKQLKRKHQSCKKLLEKFGEGLKECGSKMNFDEDSSLPCVLDVIVPSPVLENYRNKDEFSIRGGVDGNPKTVGFFLGSTAENPYCFCVPPDELVIVKESHKLLAKEFQNYIMSSPLEACYNFSDGGHWRNIIVRSNANGEVMAVVILHPQQLTQQHIEDEKIKLTDHFYQYSKSSGINLKSFYFQTCTQTRCTHAESPFQLLFGEPHVTEELNGVKYRISPESFFQVNVPAAEQLYDVIRRMCPLTKSTIVLDVCCGTGPVSFTLSPYVRKCIGIDTSAQSIEDARAIAVLNNFENVEFHTGRSEHLLDKILREIYAEELVVVINPARSALGNSVMRILRECRYLKTIIFVSCKPEALIPNFIHLCMPSRGMGAPFYPLRAIPVDLFPQTDHCELVVLFQRL